MSSRTVHKSARDVRGTGSLTGLGAGLQFLGLAGEWVLGSQQPDGTVVRPVAFAVCVGIWTAGTVLMAWGLTELRRAHREAGIALSRAGMVGMWPSVAANVLLAAFGVAVLSTGLVRGAPVEWSFVFFGLGYLLAIVGYVALALGLRRSRFVRRWWLAPLVAAAAILCALAIPLDPWHDLGLSVMSAAWVLFGLGVVQLSSGPGRPQPSEVRQSQLAE